MAKPGSDAARQLAAMSRRAADLGGKRPVPPDCASEVRRQAEGQLGMRCSGCGERITVGFQFTRIDVMAGPDGKPTVEVARLSACDREACDFAEKARPDADVVEMIEFAWLSDESGDPIPTHSAVV